MSTAFLYTDDYFAYDYGASHPLKIERLRLTHDLCRAYDILPLPEADLIESRPATEAEILQFHTAEYVEALKRASRGETQWDFDHGLGPGDNPVFPGLWEWSLLHAGASIQGAERISKGEARIVFNIAGGLHHAHASRASGFCYVNDPVLAILHFLKQGKRVLYIDIDAHHGDGVQWAFYEEPRVLTVSFHQDGRTLFPGTGGLSETGKGDGNCYAVNVPMLPGTDDHVFWHGFESVMPPLMDAFRPNVVVAQLGVDALLEDPLAGLELTTHGFTRAVSFLTEEAPALLALGGGGYNPGNVARAWTLAWAAMNGVEPLDDLPEQMKDPLADQGATGTMLRDREHASATRDTCLEYVRRSVGYLEEHVFPKIL